MTNIRAPPSDLGTMKRHQYHFKSSLKEFRTPVFNSKAYAKLTIVKSRFMEFSLFKPKDTKVVYKSNWNNVQISCLHVVTLKSFKFKTNEFKSSVFNIRVILDVLMIQTALIRNPVLYLPYFFLNLSFLPSYFSRTVVLNLCSD